MGYVSKQEHLPETGLGQRERIRKEVLSVLFHLFSGIRG